MKTLHPKCKTCFLIIVTFISVFWGCKKTENVVASPVITVTASVAGSITDLNNTPVSGASVSAGSSVTTTDANGQFSLKNIQLDKNAGFVKVTKAGYFTGSRTFLVSGNTTNNIKIQLIPKAVSGTIASSSGGNIDAAGGAKLNFTANSFVNAANNTSYSGDVFVSVFYLDPSDANFNTYMPGDLRGINTANNESIVRSFGMLSVEMNDAGGQKLQLATGKTATITIPVPSAMQAAAPATISLWYFDETKGIWKEEGTATKQTTNYVGTVSHFSFWNAGEPGADIRLEASFKNDSTGLAFINKLVTITSANFGTTNAYTDNDGKVSGLVPANEKLVITVFDDCGEINYTKTVGPFSTNTDLGNINVPLSACLLGNVTVNGTVINCNNVPVTNGYVQIAIGNNKLTATINNGSFSISYNHTSNSAAAELTVYDLSSGDSSTVAYINILEGNFDAGQVIVCNSAPPPPVANFTYTATGSFFAPVTVQFVDNSVYAVSWLWNLGDGSTSTSQNPVHTYTTGGDYRIGLTAIGQSGARDSVYLDIHVNAPANDTYINLTINGSNYTWNPSQYELSGARTDSGSVSYTSVKADSTGGTFPTMYILCTIHHDNAPAGNVPTGNYPFSVYTVWNGAAYKSYTYDPTGNPETNVTEYGGAGGYITGTASGWIKNFPVATTDSFPFTCNYRVVRIQ